jgi:hypothetical protein
MPKLSSALKAALLPGATVLGIATTASANTTDTALWKQFQYWQVRVDASIGNGCFMQAVYGATVLRIGLDMRNRTSYIMLINEEWQSLAAGQSYPVQIRFDDVAHSGWATWQGQAFRMPHGTPAMMVHFDNTEVWNAFTYGSAVHIAYGGRPLINGNLPGSAEAAMAMISCQQSLQGAGISGGSDPFKGAPASDPFKPN